MEEKRKLLQTVYSNSEWKDGKILPSHRKSFDLLVLTNEEYKEKKAASSNESDLCSVWLPEPDVAGHWNESFEIQ